MARNPSKLRSILRQRVLSLVQDGYLLCVSTESDDLVCYALKHASNGKRITISAKPVDDFMVQKSDGVVTYKGIIQP